MPGTIANRSKSGDSARLEHSLILLSWLNEQLGYENTPQLLEDIKQAAEGFTPDGRSYVYLRLIARGDKPKILPDDLARYDDNIREHLYAMNAGRAEPLTLRYFQYLAALYTEIFLDRYFNCRGELLSSLNELVNRRNLDRLPGDPSVERFAEPDLKKLAYWMATGSGKTLVMHLNYRQFLHYNREALDNILLITPNEGSNVQARSRAARSPPRSVARETPTLDPRFAGFTNRG